MEEIHVDFGIKLVECVFSVFFFFYLKPDNKVWNNVMYIPAQSLKVQGCELLCTA